MDHAMYNQLLHWLGRKSTELFNKFVINYQDNHPEVRRGVANFEANPPDPDDPYDNPDHLLSHAELTEKTEQLVKDITNTLDDDQKAVLEEITQKTLPDYNKITQEVEEFKTQLKDDGIYDRFSAHWEQYRSTYGNWSRDIMLITSELSVTELDSDGNWHLQFWSILIEGYMRSTELFLRYFVHPILKAQGIDPADPNFNYAKQILTFFRPHTKLYSQCTQDFMKSWLRHRIAHQMYYLSFDHKAISSIIFFTSAQSKSKDHELSIPELMDKVDKMNGFLLTLLTIVIDESPKLQQFRDDPLLVMYRGMEEYKLLRTTVLTDDRIKVVQPAIIEFLTTKAIREHSSLPLPFSDLLHLQNYLMDPSVFRVTYIDAYFDLLEGGRRITYLVLHEINKFRLLLPLAYAQGSTTHHIRDMLELFRTYTNNRYSSILDAFDPEMRNSIAHFTYYDQQGRTVFRDDSGEERELSTLFDPSKHVFSALDGLLDHQAKDVMKWLGMGLLLKRLMAHWVDDTDYYLRESRILKNDPAHQFLYGLSLLAGAYVTIIIKPKAAIQLLLVEAKNCLLAYQGSDILFVVYGFIVSLRSHNGSDPKRNRLSLSFLDQVINLVDVSTLKKAVELEYYHTLNTLFPEMKRTVGLS